MPDYVLEKAKWGSAALGTPGGRISWAMDGTVPASFEATLAAAFGLWAKYGNIQFQEVARGSAADITFAEASLDGANNELGDTHFTFSKGVMLSASITFDTDEGWATSANGATLSKSGLPLLSVATHEIGHAIGLDHYNAAPAIMNAVLDRAVTAPTRSDIDGIQAIYGTASGAAGTPTASQAAPTGEAALVDAAWYKAHYPDVAKAGVDPAAHYHGNGWSEGRDPDAFFSTIGYRATNPAVAASGGDPLAAFAGAGWKAGGDPSAGFDDELYLLHNPDVKAAGVNPLEHFLQHGEAEGRAAYAAIGPSASFTHGSFDAEYYLLANPDVAKAALAAGGDTFAFAFRHFDTNGWHEGRNPNAFFDTKGYLAAYHDVAANGMDPLVHYDQWGWSEGRDPSGGFDTKAYEAHNPDVAAAAIDPLQHFLQYGAAEGRGPFGDGHFG